MTTQTQELSQALVVSDSQFAPSFVEDSQPMSEMAPDSEVFASDSVYVLVMLVEQTLVVAAAAATTTNKAPLQQQQQQQRCSSSRSSSSSISSSTRVFSSTNLLFSVYRLCY